jgi:ligand-binding sensor domain-containing protein
VVWCGTSSGLYRLEQADGRWTLRFVDIGMPAGTGMQDAVITLSEDRRGSLWIGSFDSGLYRRWPDGRTERYTTQHGLPSNGIKAILQDRAGKLWVGTTRGLAMLVTEPDPPRTIVARSYRVKDGLGADWVTSLFQSGDGTGEVIGSTAPRHTTAVPPTDA